MLLSFCIPTYNRQQLLSQTLQSILSQKQAALFPIEIVISDNHSTDGTKAYVETLLEEDNRIVYHQWHEPVECGKNLLKTVELAQGEYCWLITDDDCLEKQALVYVQKILKEYPDLSGVSVNVEGYDRALKHKKKIRYSHCMKDFKVFEEAEGCFKELGAWFGYWSAHIVHRKRWVDAIKKGGHEGFLGYHHLFIMANMVNAHPKWVFTAKKCIAYRADNESFGKTYGVCRRYEIDIVSYMGVAHHFFGKKHVATRSVINKVIDAYLFWQIVTLKCHAYSVKTFINIFQLSFAYLKSYRRFWWKLFPMILMPAWMIKMIRYIYRQGQKCLKMHQN